MKPAFFLSSESSGWMVCLWGGGRLGVPLIFFSRWGMAILRFGFFCA